jgi:hypothetical protein
MKSKAPPEGSHAADKAESSPTKTRTLTLRGAHGQCAACREYFNSTHAFDAHRAGRYTPMERRCLTPDQMRAKGMAVSSTGFWVSEPRPKGATGNAVSSSAVMRRSRDIEGAATHA